MFHVLRTSSGDDIRCGVYMLSQFGKTYAQSITWYTSSNELLDYTTHRIGQQTTVNEMLATLVMEMRRPLVVHLLKKMKEGPQDEAEKVLAFLACLVSMGGHSFLAR